LTLIKTENEIEQRMRNKSTIKVEWKRKTGTLRPDKQWDEEVCYIVMDLEPCSKAGLEQ